MRRLHKPHSCVIAPPQPNMFLPLVASTHFHLYAMSVCGKCTLRELCTRLDPCFLTTSKCVTVCFHTGFRSRSFLFQQPTRSPSPRTALAQLFRRSIDARITLLLYPRATLQPPVPAAKTSLWDPTAFATLSCLCCCCAYHLSRGWLCSYKFVNLRRALRLVQRELKFY